MKTLFLLPYAGGSSMLYEKWNLDNWNLIPIEYRGHGFRFKEPLDKSIDDMAESVIESINNHLCDDMDEYVIFGHSMGGLLTYLCTMKIAERQYRSPKAIVISGCEPPIFLEMSKYASFRDDKVLIEYLVRNKRISEKKAKESVFINFFLPAIKNDYLMLSDFTMEKVKKVHVPIISVYSKEDEFMRYQVMDGWKEYGDDVAFHEVMGGHFYLEKTIYREDILKIIEEL